MKAPLGLVVGKFWPPHRGHQRLLETAAAQGAELLVLGYANPDDARHPAPGPSPRRLAARAGAGATMRPRAPAIEFGI